MGRVGKLVWCIAVAIVVAAPAEAATEISHPRQSSGGFQFAGNSAGHYLLAWRSQARNGQESLYAFGGDADRPLRPQRRVKLGRDAARAPQVAVGSDGTEVVAWWVR